MYTRDVRRTAVEGGQFSSRLRRCESTRLAEKEEHPMTYHGRDVRDE